MKYYWVYLALNILFCPMQRLLSISLSWAAVFLFYEVSWDRSLCAFRRGRASPRLLREWFDVTISTLITLLLFGYRLEVTQTTHTQLFQNTFFCLLNQVGRLGVTCNSLCVVIPLHPLPLEAVWASAGAAAAPSLGPLLPPLHTAPLLTVLGQFLISHQCNIFPWVFWILLCSPSHPSFSWLQGDFSKMQLESFLFKI